MQKWLILVGLVLIIIGVLLPWFKRIGLGQLPGDILIKRGSFTFYFPIVTCILISIILTLLFWFLRK